MPKVGEAWYEIGARDQGLVRAFAGAEGKARATGKNIEAGVGDGAEKGFAKADAAAGRFGGTIGKLTGGTSKFGGVMRNVGQGVLQGVGIAGFMGATAAAGVFIEGLGNAVSAASDLQETISKTDVVFGQNADAIKRWAADSDTAMGMSKNAALGAAATYGNLFVALKLPQDAARDMSTSLVELAGDLASFNNVPVDDALLALRSGLTGETEPLRRFGVNLNEATIAQKALEMGLISSVKDGLTPAIKAQATYGLIMDQTKTAQGDFARTSDGLANKQKIAAAQMENAMAELGSAILPIAAEIVPLLAGALTQLVRGFGMVVQGIGGFMAKIKPVTDVIFGLVGLLINGLVKSLEQAAKGFEIAFGVIEVVVGAAFDVVKFVISGIIGAIRNVIGIAAEIPGPWQEGAKAVKASLDQMQADVEAWGKQTTTSATTTGKAVPGAVATPLTDGAGIVSAAAETGITDPIVGAVKTGAVQAGAAAKATPEQVAQSLRDGQFDVKTATQGIVDAQKNTLTKAKEIAKLEAFLTGNALAKGLKDKRPAVRAEAEAWKAAAEERLWALKNGVPALAAKTGLSYADALALKKKQVGDAAKKHTDAVKAKYSAFEDKSERWGYNTGKAYADGILGASGWLRSQVDSYLAVAKARLEAKSPPIAGPLKEIDKWGERLGETYAESFRLATPNFSASVTHYLRPGASVMRERSSLSPGATTAPAAPAGAPITLAPVYAPTVSTATPAELRRAGQELAGTIARELASRGIIALPRGIG